MEGSVVQATPIENVDAERVFVDGLGWVYALDGEHNPGFTPTIDTPISLEVAYRVLVFLSPAETPNPICAGCRALQELP